MLRCRRYDGTLLKKKTFTERNSFTFPYNFLYIFNTFVGELFVHWKTFCGNDARSMSLIVAWQKRFYLVQLHVFSHKHVKILI